MEGEIQTESNPRHRLIFSAALLSLCIGIFAVAILLISSGPETNYKNKIALPDGSTVQLFKVLPGNSQYCNYKPWALKAYDYTPKFVKKFLPTVITTPYISGTTSNAITMWVRQKGPNVASSFKPFWSISYAEGPGDLGAAPKRYPSDYGFNKIPSGNNEIYYGVRVPDFPRNQKTFLFHYTDARGTNLVVFEVENPLYRGQ